MDKINKKVSDVLDLDPITVLGQADIKTVKDYLTVHKDTLAQMYAVEGFKTVMEVLIASAMRDAIGNFDDIEILRVKQGRIVALKEMLSRSRKAFEDNKNRQTLEQKYAVKEGQEQEGNKL